MFAAIVSLGMFFVFAIGDDGLRISSGKTTYGKAERAVDTTTTPARRRSMGAGSRAGQTTRKVVATPSKLQRVSERSRASDTITALMGVIALGLGLVAATLPRLRSIEIQGVKLGLADGEEIQEEMAQAAAKVAERAAVALPAEAIDEGALTELLASGAFNATYAARPIEVIETEAMAQWAHAAVAETGRRARARRIEAALSDRDSTQARLSEAEIEAIVEETRPQQGNVVIRRVLGDD
jgi:hypothetical protein